MNKPCHHDEQRQGASKTVVVNKNAKMAKKWRYKVAERIIHKLLQDIDLKTDFAQPQERAHGQEFANQSFLTIYYSETYNEQ